MHSHLRMTLIQNILVPAEQGIQNTNIYKDLMLSTTVTIPILLFYKNYAFLVAFSNTASQRNSSDMRLLNLPACIAELH